jgi:DNA-binding response OmpR family regulator
MKPKRKRILLADCHEDVLIALEKLLEDAGFDTTTAWTAKEALTLADCSAFDLVLVSEYLPDDKCEEVLKALQQGGKQTVCIVMHPCVPEFMDFVRFESFGARDIVSKRPYVRIVELLRDHFARDRNEILAA